jgi:hypothetical protein
MYVQYLVQGDIQEVAAKPVQTVGNGHSRICMYSIWYRVVTSRRSLPSLYRLLGMVTAGYVPMIQSGDIQEVAVQPVGNGRMRTCIVPGTEW